jgi:hypothetical protein
MTEGINRINTVRAVGTLDRPRVGRGRDEATVAPVWNAVRGLELSAVLQVRSPFGTPFQLPLRLDELVDGRELLACEPGMPLRADGTLEWLQREDPRYALSPTERGRRIVEVQFRPHRIIPAIQEDEPGCDVWLEGVVRRDARRYLHPDRRVPITVVSLLVQVEHLRRNTLARLIEPIEIQVAIPSEHPDMPKLIRRGNRVTVEGMLKRVVVPLRGDDPQVGRAVAALDEQWKAGQEEKQASRIDERRYARQRQRLQQTILTRVIAGYVGLIEGEPATLEEAQLLRQEFQRQRRSDQEARATHGTVADHAAAEEATERETGSQEAAEGHEVSEDSSAESGKETRRARSPNSGRVT